MNGDMVAVIAVVGGGTMGAGIAQALLSAEYSVILSEVDDDALGRAVGKVRAGLDDSARRGKLDRSPEQVLSGLVPATGLDPLARADLVIEAVPESPELKRQVLSAVDSVVRRGTLLATNTSSLSIDDLAATLRHPAHFVGMHFFNPVPASSLVEVVRGAATSTATLAVAHRVAERLGKVSIEVADSPGFATSRLGVCLGLEAIRMVEAGVAKAEDIDRAMALGYRHPVGPLRLGDLVGLDVRLAIAEHLHGTLGPRFEPPQLLRQMVADGRLGKKTGQGFYPWP